MDGPLACRPWTPSVPWAAHRSPFCSMFYVLSVMYLQDSDGLLALLLDFDEPQLDEFGCGAPS